MASGNVSGLLLGSTALGGSRAGRRGPQRDQHCTGSILLGTVANESGVSFREHLEDLVLASLCLGPA